MKVTRCLVSRTTSRRLLMTLSGCSEAFSKRTSSNDLLVNGFDERHKYNGFPGESF